jgi:hypothetical protein
MSPRCPEDSRGLALLKFSKEEDPVRYSLVDIGTQYVKLWVEWPSSTQVDLTTAWANRGERKVEVPELSD